MDRSRLFRRVIVIEIVLLALALAWRWHGAPVPPAEADPAAPARMAWRPATARERQGVIGSITAQLEAFRRDDYRKAVSYQSEELRLNFPSIAAFRATIQRGYPQFARYERVEFGVARSDPDGTHVQMAVTLTGRDGVTVHALYLMVLEGSLYRIEGVAGGHAERVAPGGMTA